MATVNPYLNFGGNCEEAFNFYRSVFDQDFLTLMRFKEVPPEYQMGESEAKKIMPGLSPLGRGTLLMGSDRPASMGPTTTGDNYAIAISTDSKEEATRLFNGLSAGGEVTMPLEEAFWGSYFGMLTDKFGIQWMVGYDYKS